MTPESTEEPEFELDDELADYEDAYNEVVEYARDEYGDKSEWPEEVRQQAAVFDEAGKAIQKRKHVLGRLEEEYGSDPFVIKMLSGKETMDVETQLRMDAQDREVSMDALQVHRNGMVVDAATVEAPEGVPTDDDGSPKPSARPNALTLALFERVERYNNSGSVDFRPEGFGETELSPESGTSETPSASVVPSNSSENPVDK